MELLWQKYETQVRDMENSRWKILKGKQCMWGSEKGTAEMHSQEFRSPIAYNKKKKKQPPKGLIFLCKPISC